jgi:hypothetical protein
MKQPMTSLEKTILETLIELDQQVKTISATGSKPNLLPLFARLDELAARLPADAPGELRHYLQRKSHEKARLFLEGRDGENAAGNCGRH